MKNTRCPLLLLLALTAACGEDMRERPDTPSVPTDRFSATLETLSSTNDCDPAPGDKGEFSAYLEIYTRPHGSAEWALVANTAPRAVGINAEYGVLSTAAFGESAHVDVPRLDQQGILVAVHVAELDAEGQDAPLEGRSQYIYDAGLACWYSLEHQRCGGGRFELNQTYREDLFILFNPDDEGCQAGAVWSTALYTE